MSPGQKLRELVAESAIQVPGAPNALLARLIERLGYEAMYLSGAAFSNGVLGLPDVGLFTLTELALETGYLTRASSLPLIVDADTGFGDVLNVERTVIELRAAGAAAIQLEDQQSPKRCGHLAGKSLIEPAAMCAKLKAAVAAREDDDLVLIARTDARGVTSLDDAIERAKRYIGAGADWIFPEALVSKDEFARFADAIDAPLVANMTEFGKSPLLTLQELADLGYSIALYPVTLQRITLKACEAALNLIASEGTQADILDLMQTREELYDLIDYPAFEERDRSYSTDK
ncbi:MAG TPA: methylisocitrate lyase [Pirellulaceae bacterium]|nr:methylisocitrate lyase [Pirellulaceae bacterium]